MKALQNKLGALALCSLLLVATLPLTGCPQQTTLAALTNTLGTAAASIAALEGNPTLAAQLQSDTAAAVTAIQNWKPGTPAQDAIQALNIVIDDLSLICPPNGPCGPYAPLVLLALGTAQSIIIILNPTASAFGAKRQTEKVSLTLTPKTPSQFRAQWNAICKGNPVLASATLK